MPVIRLLNPDEPPIIHQSQVQFGQRLMDVDLPEGLPEYDEIIEELHGYVDVFLGRAESPLASPYLAMAEVATAFLSRAYELEMLIYEGEQNESIDGGRSSKDPYHKLRTGALASFISMAKRLADLGSRRLTQEQLLSDQRRDSGEAL